jgi:hypothetical protein
MYKSLKESQSILKINLNITSCVHERGKFIMIWHLHTHTHTPSFSHVIRGARLRPWNYLKGHHIQTPTYKMPWPCPISPRYVPSIRYSWGFYVPLIFLVKMAEDWNHFITLPLNFTRVSTLIALSHLSLTYLMPSIFLIQKKKSRNYLTGEKENLLHDSRLDHPR